MVLELNYKEKKLPIRISYRAMKGFKKDQKFSIGQVEKKLESGEADVEVYETLLWHGLLSGCKAVDKDLKEDYGISREDAEDILDECFTDFIQMMPKFFPTAGDVVSTEKKERPEKEPAKS